MIVKKILNHNGVLVIEGGILLAGSNDSNSTINAITTQKN